jgi:sodium transport system permease protein
MLGADKSGFALIRVPQTSILEALKSGTADAFLEIPDAYEKNTLAGKDVTLRVTVDRSHATTASVEKKLDKLFRDYQQWVFENRLASYHLPSALAEAPKESTTDLATTGQAFGLFLARTLPVLLLATGMLGSFYPALNATTTERELGTLETLLVTPATRGELLTAKAAIVLLCGLLTAWLNMVSMSLVLWKTIPSLQKMPGGASIDPVALGLSFLAAVPTLIFFSALVLMVGLLAQNLREANAYATPVMIIPITSLLVGIAEPATTPALLITPVANTTIIIQDILTGHFRAWEFFLAFASSCVYAGLVLSLAGRLFTNEQLVNPGWEPISLKGLGRRKWPRRFPAVDEAISLFCLVLLLSFYGAPREFKHGLRLMVWVEVGLIAAPTLAFAWLGRYRWREVFSLRWPSLAAVVGAILIGAGLIPSVNLITWLQQHFQILPPGRSDVDASQMFDSTLRAFPIFAPIFLGLMAGVCEELLFRGPIQSALVRRLPVWAALCAGGFLFSATHMNLFGLPIRWGLGIILGWVVWQTGSIVPAMLMHWTFDSVQLAYQSHLLFAKATTQAAEEAMPLATPQGRLIFAGGIVLLAVGWYLVRRPKAQDMEVGSPPATAGGVEITSKSRF